VCINLHLEYGLRHCKNRRRTAHARFSSRDTARARHLRFRSTFLQWRGLRSRCKFRHSRGGGSENAGKCNLLLLEKRRIQDVTHSKWFRVSPSVQPHRSLAFSFVDPIVCVNVIPVFIYTVVYRCETKRFVSHQSRNIYVYVPPKL